MYLNSKCEYEAIKCFQDYIKKLEEMRIRTLIDEGYFSSDFEMQSVILCRYLVQSISEKQLLNLVRKSPIKSALLTDTLKFTMFSRHFGSCWDTQHFFLATKLLLLLRSMRIDFNRFRFRKRLQKEKILQIKGILNYEFKQYKSKFKQLNTIGS